MSEAAKAYENCDRIFKPVFADPRPNKDNYGNEPFNSGGTGRSASMGGPRPSPMIRDRMDILRGNEGFGGGGGGGGALIV